MKMQQKKETKHTVVYETTDDGAPISSVYVSKVWLRAQQPVGAYPAVIELEVKIPTA